MNGYATAWLTVESYGKGVLRTAFADADTASVDGSEVRITRVLRREDEAGLVVVFIREAYVRGVAGIQVVVGGISGSGVTGLEGHGPITVDKQVVDSVDRYGLDVRVSYGDARGYVTARLVEAHLARIVKSQRERNATSGIGRETNFENQTLSTFVSVPVHAGVDALGHVNRGLVQIIVPNGRVRRVFGADSVVIRVVRGSFAREQFVLDVSVLFVIVDPGDGDGVLSGFVPVLGLNNDVLDTTQITFARVGHGNGDCYGIGRLRAQLEEDFRRRTRLVGYEGSAGDLDFGRVRVDYTEGSILNIVLV